MHGKDDSNLDSGSAEELLPAECLECDCIVLGGGLCSSCRNSSCSGGGKEEENQVVAAPMVEL